MGKTAVVTGGGRGIGRAVSLKFASMGYDVAIIFKGGEEAASATAGECRAMGAKAEIFRCDVSSFEEAAAVAAEIKKAFGTVEVLVNNAGVTRDNLALMMGEDDWDAVIGANLKGAFNMIRHITPLILRNKKGSVVNVSSVSGLMGNPGQINYAASKAGLVGMTKTLAKELAPRGITCNAVAPGFIETDMTKGLEDVVSSIPLKRMGKPEEIADAVAFLATNAYVTGEVLRVDGGVAM